MTYSMFVAFAVAIFLAVPILTIFVIIRAMQKHKWNQGEGERAGKAEYAKLSRERPQLRDAQLSEAEFVHKFVKAGPGRYYAS